MEAKQIEQRVLALGDPGIAHGSLRFFKTGPGEYGEGDSFAGLRIPAVRKLASEYRDLPLAECSRLLRSRVHEVRMLALLILVRAYAKGEAAARERIFGLYLKSTRRINNWDLVDASAEHIVGAHLVSGSANLPILDELAASRQLWERRIAIMATFHFVKKRQFEPTLRIAEKLLRDEHELIHKAVGWMLREVGNRDLTTEERFLRRHAVEMPRTMLRYAIEKFPEGKRKAWMVRRA